MTDDEIREFHRWAGCWEAQSLVKEIAGPCGQAAEREDVQRTARWLKPRTSPEK